MKYNGIDYKTDREKRQETDKEIKRKHLEYTDEQVKKERELYLRNKYSYFNTKPMPEYRMVEGKYGELTKKKI